MDTIIAPLCQAAVTSLTPEQEAELRRKVAETNKQSRQNAEMRGGR
ncbi:hypothetical protein [Streptomyces litchfieldiae]|uniref:Uncharacterized protein n=1 Tax=Streptomyces litchfieldiae TaxID=3075543 RepID=A0ABU2N0Z2_9ACTN|nr:hypothetical protein [Streptomyces sp. DSM 44938]MDT0347550.1 hypothetical protein [Streptomyces sp. DSM 44938]